jgi:hypothetical protein
VERGVYIAARQLRRYGTKQYSIITERKFIMAAKKAPAKSKQKPKPKAKTKAPVVKASAKKRMVNTGKGPNPDKGAPFNEQDPERRLGNFTTAGEHARVGGRGRIIGQTKQKFSTDKGQK